MTTLPKTLVRFSCILAALLIVSSLRLATAHAAPGSPECASDVLFLGARGSGQAYEPSSLGMGDQVFSAFRQVGARLSSETPQSTVSGVPVEYPAKPVSDIVSDPASYFGGIQIGVERALQTLRRWADDPGCQRQDIVLGGYSQGAIVMHRVLRELTNGQFESVVPRIAGALLVADGDRISKDNVALVGDSPKTAHGISLEFPLLSGASKDALPSPWNASRVFSICKKGDPVCGIDNVPVLKMLADGGGKLHSDGYKDDASVNKAVKSLKISYVGKVDPSSLRISGASGVDLNASIRASIGPGCSLAWAKKGKWPTWLGLSGDGVVHGRPPTAYRANLSATLRSACPERRSQTGTYTVSVDLRAHGSDAVPIAEIAPWSYGSGDVAVDAGGAVTVVKCCKPRQVTSLARGASSEKKLNFPFFQKADGIGRVAVSALGGVVVATEQSTKTQDGNYSLSTAVERLKPGSTTATRLPDVGLRLYSVAIDAQKNVLVAGVVVGGSPTYRVMRWSDADQGWSDVSGHFSERRIVELRTGPDGSVFALDESGLLTRDGSPLAWGISRPLSVAPDGGVLYRDGNGLKYLANDASTGADIDSSRLGNIDRMAIGPDGTVWFTVFQGAAGQRVVNARSSLYR
ncbi:cutinase family protein [uncultured Williamsia sp.]|uniref:cutinase family protein n=1 Tax=uncultured Williamsia sp. TaxID=259311 RepID=UPI0026020623|nr:cutinase family protein [uncultured Williamsia sp.]